MYNNEEPNNKFIILDELYSGNPLYEQNFQRQYAVDDR